MNNNDKKVETQTQLLESQLAPSKALPKQLETYWHSQIDVVPRQSLEPYDDGRRWFLVKESELWLGMVAQVVMDGDGAQMKIWLDAHQVSVYSSLQRIEGEMFQVIWFENAYVLARYSRGGSHE
ncbi:MAG: hypothetical protein AAGA75_00420 [Cyanobacteria bacterium P01_E01_bin.6]